MPAFLPIVSKFDNTGLKKGEAGLKKFSKIAGGIATAATAAVAGIAVAGVREFAKFDEALNKSTAIMGDVSDAMRDEMAQAARDVAKETRFAADEAAESFFFLASAGLDAEQQIAAMPQVAKFAQAGMFDMALATDLATDAQSALGLASDDAQENLNNLTRVTDVFVKANTLANTSVEQLAAAFTTKAGTALKTVGKDVEEGAAALAVFADQGIKGERAGTLLTNTIFGLTDIMKKAPDEAKALGIEIFDAEGNLKSFADVSENLTDVLGTMTKEQQISTISQLGLTKQAREGVFAMLGNADAIREYETALRDAGGTTEEVANKQLQTPAAQFDLLKSSVMDLLLEFKPLTLFLGDLAAGFRPIVDSLGPKVREFFERLTPSLETAGENFKNLGEAFKNGEETIGGVFTGIFEKIGEFFTGDGLGNFLEKLMELRQTIIFNLIEIIPAIAEGIAAALPSIVRTLADMIPTMLQNAIIIFEQLIEALNIVFPQIITALVESIPEMIDALMFQLPLIIQGAIDLFTGLLDGLIEVLPTVLEALIGAIPVIVEALVGALPKIVEGALELFLGLVTGLLDALPTILKTIIEIIPDITTQLVAMLPDIIEAAMDLWLGIITGLVDATPDILTAIIELIPEITTALLDQLPQLVQAGFDILKGIAEGILTNLPRIASELASSIGNAIRGGVERFFGIQSPSKLMMGIGHDIIAGLQKGIEDNQELAVGASLEMASNVKFASESAFDGLQTASAIDTRGPIETLREDRSAPSSFNITINAGTGTDPVSVGRAVVDAIKRYEATNGKVFASA